MSFQDDVVAALAVGTGRRAPEGDWPDAVAEFRRETADDETSLLTAAATCYVGRRLAWSVPAPTAPPSMPRDDPRRPVNEAAHRRLMGLLDRVLVAWPMDSRRMALISEWIALAEDRNLRPRRESVLPLLSVGVGPGRTYAEAIAIARTVGPLGEWLATLNEKWSWVIGVVDPRIVWDRGNRSALTCLALLDQDPAALSLIAAFWHELNWGVRKAVVARLGPSRRPDAMAVLDCAVRDDAEVVRDAARRALLRVPDSAQSRRNLQRARALVSFPHGGTPVEITLPPDDDPTRDDDTMEVYPNDGRAVAATISRIVAAVPPSVWHDWTGLAVDDLLGWAETTDWDRAFLAGWLVVSGLFEDEAWASALLRRDRILFLFESLAGPAVQRLSTDELDRIFPQLSEQSATFIISGPGRPLGPEASRRALDLLADSDEMRGAFPLQPQHLDVGAVAQLAVRVDAMQIFRDEPLKRRFVRTAEHALELLNARAEMRNEFGP